MPVFISAWAGACVGIALVFRFSRGSDDNWSLWKLVAGGMAVNGLFNFCAIAFSARIVELYKLPAVPPAYLWLWVPFFAIGNLGVLSAALGIGQLVARGMKKVNYLIVAVTAGAVSDLISVFAGPSKVTLQSDFFPYVAYHWGLIGMGEVVPMVGAGDFIFLAIYFAGARRFGLDTRKSLLAMFAAFGAGFAMSAFYIIALPALPFMGVAFLAVHRQELRERLAAQPAH